MKWRISSSLVLCLLTSTACQHFHEDVSSSEGAVPKAAAHARAAHKIFVTAKSLPKGSFEAIGPVKGVDPWYGGKGSAYEILAGKARELGADAVIEVRTWRQPGGLAWASPAGEGLAVKVKDKAVLKGVEGHWE